MLNIFRVSNAEAGIGLLRFIERRLGLPRTLVYRWLRTGQIRVNGSRSKAGRVLVAGDEVRLPPQALTAATKTIKCPVESQENAKTILPDNIFGSGLEIVLQDEQLLVLNKASGLPAQDGSKHTDSVCSRLKRHFAAQAFIPAPAHRLDKQSSGLLLAGRTLSCQRYLHSLFSGAISGLVREYLVWVKGRINPGSEFVYTSYLRQEAVSDGLERMNSYIDPPEDVLGLKTKHTGKAAKAVTGFKVIKTVSVSQLGSVSLLLARLHTGRKHQIRAQCAALGQPVVGDLRYGGPAFKPMLLHAFHLYLPEVAWFRDQSFTERDLYCFPDWPAPFQVTKEILV